MPGAVTIGTRTPLRAGALDGTLLRVPDTPANRAAFGTVGSGDDSGPYPCLRALPLTCCSCRALLAMPHGHVGHSVLGRGVRLGAFFCVAVRNLRRGTVHMMSGGVLTDTGETTIGCVVADGIQTGVRATVMPGRRIVHTPVIPPNAVVTRNC